MCGIRVYHDFPWTSVFPDERTQFKNGLSLAKLVIEDCPSEKEPALLLTVDDSASEGALETANEYVVVVRLHHYLAEAGSDAAAAYYAHNVSNRITQLTLLEQVSNSPALVDAVIKDNLSVELVTSWLAGSPERLAELRESLGELPHAGHLSPGAVAAVLATIDEVPGPVWSALVEILPAILEDDTRQLLLNAITGDSDGRAAASATLGARIEERISDTKEAILEYEQILAGGGANETQLQEFIQQHPWMVGLDYVAVRPKVLLPRGQLDFCLERFDGYYDVLELKGPEEPIVIAPPSSDGLPPSASAFKLGPALANALAQVHVYRDILTTDSAVADRLYGLRNSRDPRLIIVVGQASAMAPECQRVLEQLNLSLHRVEVMPYDILGKRAVGWLTNVESYLTSDTLEIPRGGVAREEGGSEIDSR